MHLIIILISLFVFTHAGEKMSIYDFSVKDIDNIEVPMSKYKGKVLLIVNVASKCGFTPQYKGLEKLYKMYRDKNFMVLGFPCNQFSNQEPASNDEIKFFCISTYNVDFDIFAKIDVNGEKAIPLYQYLKKEQTGAFWTKSIKWNFTKFLIDKKGKVIKRYGSSTKPMNIEEDIKKLL
jgi:glutathione peroxidase